MLSRSIFLSLLPFGLLLFQQAPDPDAAHIKKWTERHEHYLPQPKTKETDSWLEITANDPRPLDGVLDALGGQHGWHINYEDPLYGESDILDDTAPSWLKEHPTGRRAYAVAGGAAKNSARRFRRAPRMKSTAVKAPESTIIRPC
jgi:hypothetical protein